MVGIGNTLQNIHNFDPDTSIPDLSSKVIIITGGNSGVGKESVLRLVKHKPQKLYLTARSRSKFDAALADICKIVPDAKSSVHFLELDLASFASIQSATNKFLSENDRLDILMNNAGVMALPPGLTTEGYEIHFGTNHVGTAFLTKLLLPILLETASDSASDVRIVNLSSVAYTLAPGRTGIPFLDNESKQVEIKKPDGGHIWTYTRYGASKLANIMHARKLAELYGDKGIHAVAVHPGRVSTNLLSNRFSLFDFTGWFQYFADIFMGPMSVRQGAMNQLWGATWERSKVTNGGYFVPVGAPVDASEGKKEVHKELADRLWEWQEKEFDTWLEANKH